MPDQAGAAGEARGRARAVLLATVGVAALAAFLIAALTRLELERASWPARTAVVTWAALLACFPRRGAYVVLLAIPLFGNHPGGRLMELLDVGVAASTIGLALRALRQRRAPPGGALWATAGAMLLCAGLSLVPVLPAVWIRTAQIDDWRSTLTQTLTSPETVPLYSLAHFLELVLAVAWGYSLSWSVGDRRFARNALRCIALGLFIVVLLGALDYHRVIDLHRDYLTRIDPEDRFPGHFRSIFWNPGWFAWYFSLAFGLSLGLLWLESRGRRALAGGLVLCYGYFLMNSQRGGVLAVHAVLLAALIVLMWRRSWRAYRRLAWVGAALAAVFTVWIVASSASPTSGSWPPGVRRLLTVHEDVNRRGLWAAALLMWRHSPVLGAGESSFAWRLREYLPAGRPFDVGQGGDAHDVWLQILATRGLVGLLAYLAFLAALAGRVRAALRAGGPERGLGLSVLLGLVAFVTYSFVQCLSYLQATQVLFWGMVAIAAIAAPPPPGRPRVGRAAVGALAVAWVGAGTVEVYAQRAEFRAAAAKVAREPRGFYALQGGVRRWSSRRGTLCVYPSGPVMALQLSTSDPRARDEPVGVTLHAGGRLLDRLALRQGGVSREYYLPEATDHWPLSEGVSFGQCLPGLDAVPLSVEVDRVWSPKSSGSLDGRIFGVTLFAPSFRGWSPGDAVGLSPVQGGARALGATGALVLGAVPAGSEVTVPVRVPGLDRAQRAVEVTLSLSTGTQVTESLSDDAWHPLRVRSTSSTQRLVVSLQVDRVASAETLPLAGGSFAFVGLQVGEPALSGARPAR